MYIARQRATAAQQDRVEKHFSQLVSVGALPVCGCARSTQNAHTSMCWAALHTLTRSTCPSMRSTRMCAILSSSRPNDMRRAVTLMRTSISSRCSKSCDNSADHSALCDERVTATADDSSYVYGTCGAKDTGQLRRRHSTGQPTNYHSDTLAIPQQYSSPARLSSRARAQRQQKREKIIIWRCRRTRRAKTRDAQRQYHHQYHKHIQHTQVSYSCALTRASRKNNAKQKNKLILVSLKRDRGRWLFL